VIDSWEINLQYILMTDLFMWLYFTDLKHDPVDAVLACKESGRAKTAL